MASNPYAYEKDRVLSLPGWAGPLPFNMFAGYLEGSSTSRLFYIYVEADEISPQLAPITAWFNGGPGCSSLDGFWYEHGPFLLDKQGNLSLKPYRWNRLSNMLYIEAPVGVGMSYSLSNAYKVTDDTTARENKDAMADFFSKFPGLRSHRFFLTGESYAGIYVPTLAEAILDAQDAKQWAGPALVGIGVGNGCTGTASGICGYYFGDQCDGLYYEYKFLSGFSFFSNTIKNDVDKHCDWSQCTTPADASSAATTGGLPLSNLCVAALDKGMELLSLINIYNVIGSCTFASCEGPVGNERVGRVGTRSQIARLSNIAARSLSGTTATASQFDDEVAQITDAGPAECIDSVDASNYMNRHDVQAALHAKNPGFCWAVCNHVAGWKYTSTRQNLPRDLYPRLVSRLKVVIYNGDMDACVPYTDNEAWTEKMGFPVRKNWHPWSYNSGNSTGTQVAGYAIEYDVSALGKGSFEFKTVRGAGHMVPTDQPEPALELFRRLIEIPSENVSYADVTTAPLLLACPPSRDSLGGPPDSSISPQAGLALILLIFVLFAVVVALYQELRAAKQRVAALTNAAIESGSIEMGQNQIDISERSETRSSNQLDISNREADGDTIELTKGFRSSSSSSANPF